MKELLLFVWRWLRPGRGLGVGDPVVLVIETLWRKYTADRWIEQKIDMAKKIRIRKNIANAERRDSKRKKVVGSLEEIRGFWLLYEQG